MSDDSQLIWSTATIGELLRRLNVKCVECINRKDAINANRYACLSDSIKNAIKEVGLDKENDE